jgi:hypothetical protein
MSGLARDEIVRSAARGFVIRNRAALDKVARGAPEEPLTEVSPYCRLNAGG